MRDQHILDLMEAYASIYEAKEKPEMESGKTEKPKKPGKDEGGKHKEGKHPVGEEEPGEKVTEKEGKEKEKEMKESADLFDYILEHLVAEGYADTNEAAIAIMANMSEEWKQSIVEADSLAAQQARREERLRRQRKREGRPSGGGDFGHDYGKPRAQADAEREQRMKDFINKKD